ncbi:MAG: polysaccharide biosynthesis protein [Bacillota bacterium]|nr:polysaccharide biosynthesis protein [Bacillota bacterium]
MEEAGVLVAKGHSFVKGALILTAAGLFVRFMGAGLRVFLAAVMGDEGIGLYQMAYPIYTTLLAISTAGIPIAVSKLVAENLAHRDYRGALRVFKISLWVLALLGAIFTLILYFGADFFVRNIVKDPRAFYPLVAISPAIFIVTILSAYRGFFQGQQDMMPTAISQIMEQIGRIVIIIVLVFLLLPRGLEFAAAGAAFGAVAGALLGMLPLLYFYYKNKGGFSNRIKKQIIERDFSSRAILSRIILLSIPITLGSLVVPLINLVDLSVVPLRLHDAGYSTSEATALYGQLTGMASSVIQFPLILTIALAMTLVPAISEAQTLGNNFLVQKRTEIAMRFTLFFSIPASLGLFVLAGPTTLVLFENAPSAYPLSILAFGVVFLSLYIATSGILQGLGYVMEPVKYMVLGAVLKTILSWILTADPSLHIGGAAFATVISFAVASFLNIRKVSQVTQWKFNFKDLVLKPLTASIFMSWGSFTAYRIIVNIMPAPLSLRMAQAVALFAAILFGFVIFVIVLSLIGGVREEDLTSVPRVGGRLLKIARRLNLIK